MKCIRLMFNGANCSLVILDVFSLLLLMLGHSTVLFLVPDHRPRCRLWAQRSGVLSVVTRSSIDTTFCYYI